MFGLALERDRPGVVLDTLGVPGTRVRDHLFWDDAVYREHLARRKPDMVVLAYGTNESGDDDVPLEQYEAALRRVIARVHEVAKDASCLLIGPSDRPMRNDDGTFSPRPLTEQISDVQRARIRRARLRLLRPAALHGRLDVDDALGRSRAAARHRRLRALHAGRLRTARRRAVRRSARGFAPATEPAVALEAAAITKARRSRGTLRTP